MNHLRMTRRSFLGTTAARRRLCALQRFSRLGPWPQARATGPSCRRRRIYKVYAGRTGDMYLARPTEELAKFEQYFAELEKKLGDVKFIGGDMIPPANVDQLAEKVRDADAVLLIHLSGARRRRARAGQAHRRGAADGAVLAAVQRPRLDVLPAMAQAGQEGRPPAEQRLEGDGPRGGPAARAGLAEADPHHRLGRAARHRRRVLRRADQEAPGRGTGVRQQRPGAADDEGRSTPRPPKPRPRNTGSARPRRSSSPSGRRSSNRRGCTWRSRS